MGAGSTVILDGGMGRELQRRGAFDSGADGAAVLVDVIRRGIDHHRTGGFTGFDVDHGA